MFATPVLKGELQLHDNLFEADAIIFDAIVSRRLRCGAEWAAQLELAFLGMPQLGMDAVAGLPADAYYFLGLFCPD